MNSSTTSQYSTLKAGKAFVSAKARLFHECFHTACPIPATRDAAHRTGKGSFANLAQFPSAQKIPIDVARALQAHLAVSPAHA